MPPEAQYESPSLIEFLFRSLGVYGIVLPIVAMVSFLVVLVMIVRGRGALASATMVLACLLPVLVGAFGFLDGMLSSLRVIGMSTVAPKPSDLAEGVATALSSAIVAMFLSLPSLVLAIVGGTIRALIAPHESK